MATTPRENLLRLLRRQGYDQVPYDFFLCPHLIEVFHEQEKTEQSYFDYFQIPWRRLTSLRPDNDDRSRFAGYYAGQHYDEIDEWGIGHYATPSSMHMSYMLHPLLDADSEEEILSYPLPSYSLEKNPQAKAEAQALKDRGLVAVGNMQCTVWETAWYIRGMENLMMDMAAEDPMAELLLDRVTEMSAGKAKRYAEAGVDVLFLGDDVGMQNSLMMSQSMYKTWLQPRLKRVIDSAREVNPDILVCYHSCGYIEPLIEPLIEAGIDILDPVQPECMDAEKILREYAGRLSFHGVIGTQTTMPFGTPEQIRTAVKHYLDIAGDKGGLFIAPTHLLEPEVPWENIRAYVQACRDYTR